MPNYAKLGDIYKSTKSAVDKASLEASVIYPETQERYIQDIKEEQTFIQRIVRPEKMNSDVKDLDMLNIDGDVLNGGIELPTDEDGNDASADFSTHKNKIVASYFTGSIDVRDDAKADNLEGDDIENTLIDMFSDKSGANVERILVFGNTELGSAHTKGGYNKIDGLIKLSGNKIYASSLTGLDPEKPSTYFKHAIEAMPVRYRKKNYAEILCPYEIFEAYREELAARQTALGDKNTVDGAEILYYKGFPVVYASVLNDPFPATENGGTGAVITVQYKNNAVWGINKEMTAEAYRDPRKAKTQFIFRQRFGTNYENENASSVLFLEKQDPATV